MRSRGDASHSSNVIGCNAIPSHDDIQSHRAVASNSTPVSNCLSLPVVPPSRWYPPSPWARSFPGGVSPRGWCIRSRQWTASPRRWRSSCECRGTDRWWRERMHSSTASSCRTQKQALCSWRTVYRSNLAARETNNRNESVNEKSKVFTVKTLWAKLRSLP